MVEVAKRVKSSLGVRKDLFNDGTVKIHAIWDVTDLSKKVGRYYQRSRMDDYIRPQIGHRKGSTGEVHELPPTEIKLRVDKYLALSTQALPTVGLTAWQARSAELVLCELANNKTTIIAELCARFGKTIWTGSLIRETNTQLTIVVSYVLTSFASFEKDLSGFEQFKDLVLIDTADEEYQEVIDTALSKGKQVVAFLSMCVGSKRQQKIDFLYSRDVTRLTVVDEADFGVHKVGQAKPLIEARGVDDPIILMTGTNADKAASYWPVDSTLSVVYPELLMEKRLVQKSYTTSLQHFKIDTDRHDLVVDIEFYQMDLKSAVEFARRADPDAFVDDGIYLPSWTKFAAYPAKAKGFWTRMLQAVFLGQHGWDELNVDFQTERSLAKEGQRVAMMFLSGSMRNENLEEAVALARQALPGFTVVAVYGDEMSNRTAESQVKEAIEKAATLGQDVLLLSAGMAQRSFSVGAITELYLAYDTGDNGATIQKISRALTPDQQGKIGRIVSLSFDPNRDDKFDALLIETALNYKQTHNKKSAKEALREVLRTVDIFSCTADGSIKLEGDEYLEHAIERNSVSRVAGKASNLSLLSAGEIIAVAQGNANVYKAAKEAAAQKGKTKLSNKNTNSNNTTDDLASAKMIAKAREVITTIVENMDIIVLGTNTNILTDAFDAIAADNSKRQAVEQEFGLDFDLLRDLFDRGVINTDIIELQVDN
jgi:cytochrome oxidase Cu insertion factor (SCO1/SenC/PrrC family)